MLDIKIWLSASGIGILFGLFPAWWWFSAHLIYAVIHEKKEVPRWMNKVVETNPGFGLFSLILSNKHYYPTILRIFAVVWVVAFLSLFHRVAWFDISRGNLISVALFESSFTLFLFLMWLLPTYFLKRYLRRLRPEMDTVSVVVPSKKTPNIAKTDNIAKSMTLIFLFMLAIAIIMLYGQPLTSLSVILAIAGLAVVGYFTVIVNLRVRRGKSRSDHEK